MKGSHFVLFIFVITKILGYAFIISILLYYCVSHAIRIKSYREKKQKKKTKRDEIAVNVILWPSLKLTTVLFEARYHSRMPRPLFCGFKLRGVARCETLTSNRNCNYGVLIGVLSRLA